MTIKGRAAPSKNGLPAVFPGAGATRARLFCYPRASHFLAVCCRWVRQTTSGGLP